MAATGENLVLYDLARRPGSDGKCSCWSFNVWKVRLVLNYKNIPYRTEWVTHANISERVKATDVAPNESPQSGSAYTVPTVVFANGDAMRESADIVRKLDELYPQPELEFDDTLGAEAQRAIGAIAGPLLPEYMYRIGHHIIVEESKDHFLKDREAKFGMSLEKFKESKGGEQAWKAAEPGFKLLEKLLTEHKKDDGPFILGSRMCYADCIVAAMAESVRRIDPEMGAKCQIHGAHFEKLRAEFERRGWMRKDD